MSLRFMHLEILEPGIYALMFCCHACLKSKSVLLKCRWKCLATRGQILLGSRFSLYVFTILPLERLLIGIVSLGVWLRCSLSYYLSSPRKIPRSQSKSLLSFSQYSGSLPRQLGGQNTLAT